MKQQLLLKLLIAFLTYSLMLVMLKKRKTSDVEYEAEFFQDRLIPYSMEYYMSLINDHDHEGCGEECDDS